MPRMVDLKKGSEVVWVNPLAVTMVRDGGGDAIIHFAGGSTEDKAYVRVSGSVEDVARELTAGLNATGPRPMSAEDTIKMNTRS